MVRVFSHGFQVPSSAAVATGEAGAIFVPPTFSNLLQVPLGVFPTQLGWAEVPQVLWNLPSSQVTEQWASCAGQETPDTPVWRAQMLRNVMNQLQPSPQLSYSKNARNSLCFTSQNNVFYTCNKAEQLFNVLSEFSSLWLNLNLRFFLIRLIFEGTPLKTEVSLLFSLSFSWQVISSTAHKQSWFTVMLLKYVEEI